MPPPPPAGLYLSSEGAGFSVTVTPSASLLQYDNMNVAGVDPSVFFVSKNVVPFVNSKEKY